MKAHKANVTKPLDADAYLRPFMDKIAARQARAEETEKRLTGGNVSLEDFASGHEYFGLHFSGSYWIFREWAPNASAMFLVGDFSGWKELPQFCVERLEDKNGVWELRIQRDILKHGMHYKLKVYWDGGSGYRIPSYARRVVQDDASKIFSAQVWKPRKNYVWKNNSPKGKSESIFIYESHVGMGQEDARVGTYSEFKDKVLPRVKAGGYDTVQIMATMEHPYYGSFGYHVSSFFAASSRFGTPEELKELVDTAHGMGLRVIIDLVHSHAVKNEVEGLGRFDGTVYQYFHEGGRGVHSAWDSYCFNYSKPEVLHFLLSNCRFWLDEYHVDGFRFDGVTSMLYLHHGLGGSFGSYHDYFTDMVDEDAVTYLTLANKLIHSVRKDAVTVAEDVSGMPGLGAPVEQGGCGFDYRLAMGVTDYWFKLFDQKDEDWSMSGLWHELTNRRQDEKTISYVECHDQSIVGGKTMAFTLMDADMYYCMHKDSQNMTIDRGMALHKMARLITAATGSNGYLNFMGNEFGHPEWVDFPREGNGWSYHYARRQWSLATHPDLRYQYLDRFDRDMMALIGGHDIVNKACVQKLYVHDEQKVIAFERGGLFFFFNFNPFTSFTDFPVETLPGEYRLVLDTDGAAYGGHQRIQPEQTFFTIPRGDQRHLHHYLHLYLPARSAMVLERVSKKFSETK
ncbi:MAG: alpha amylase C-terminal domain-containing protein [Victivallales bacterium]|nr:alpha amylase C-terminal domain-containing protein [Victivallales bacterium]